MRVDACVFNLMQIGELAKASMTDEFKEKVITIEIEKYLDFPIKL